MHKTDNIVEHSYNSKSVIEIEADKFASFFLMPYNEVVSLTSINGEKEFDVIEVMEISQMFRMSYKGTLLRLKEIFGSRVVPEMLWDKKPLILAELFNMDEQLYKPTNEKYWSTNKYISTAYKALHKEKISFSKFLELMKEIGLNGYDVLENINAKN